MEIISHDQRIVQRSYWFIKLRWLAIAGLFLMILFALLMNLKVQFFGLFIILAGLIIHNLLSIRLLKKLELENRLGVPVYRHVFYQITVDLIFLTILLYFSGGMENPFILFYSFHIVLGAILLPKKISYWIAVIATFLFLLLGTIEYSEILPSYSLGLFNYSTFNLQYILSLFILFSVTNFVLVYLVSNISDALKKQEQWLFVTNKKLIESNEQLKDKDRIKDEYVSRISHDIKNDLSVIQTNLTVLKKQIPGELTDSQMKFVEIALKRTHQLSDFTSKLLKITRSRLNKTVSKEKFILNDVINRVVEKMKPAADEKNINVSVKLEDTLQAYGDSFSIEEAIMNLVSNSIKYTPDNGKVNIIGSQKANYNEIIVEDTGIGIPKAELNNLFTDFFRASNAKQKKIQGTGLGLSLVYNIIKNNSGFIKVESEENKGSRFYVNIPVAN